jgi:hypothetical protein
MKGVGGGGLERERSRGRKKRLKIVWFLLDITLQVVSLLFISDIFAAFMVAILKATGFKLRWRGSL